MNQFETGFEGALYTKRRLARRRRRVAGALLGTGLVVAAFVFALSGEEPHEAALAPKAALPSQAALAPDPAPMSYDVVEPRAMSLPGTMALDLRDAPAPTIPVGGTIPPAVAAAPLPLAPSPADAPPPPEALPEPATAPPPPEALDAMPPPPDAAATISLLPPAAAEAPPAAQEPPPSAAEPPLAPERKPAVVAEQPRIQLAAVRSKTRAHRAWRRLQKAQPDLLGALTPVVAKADGASLWRVQAAVPTDARARRVCDELQRRRVECFVVRR
jgi:hypothetical protein